MDGPRPYVAYLLRLWQVHTENTLTWRASLESPYTGERQSFGSLEGLFEYLQARTILLESEQDSGTEENLEAREFGA
jgi:hypothetical protein